MPAATFSTAGQGDDTLLVAAVLIATVSNLPVPDSIYIFLLEIASGDNTSAHGMTIGEKEMLTPFAAYGINSKWSLSQAEVATSGGEIANNDCRARKLHMSVDSKANLDQPEINGSWLTPFLFAFGCASGD